jgi:hypothetical protein
MTGFLGTRAPLQSDVSLLLTVALLLAAIFGYIQARRRRFGKHCPIQAIAGLGNWVPILVVMVPRLIGILAGEVMAASGIAGAVPIFHAVLGSGVQLLMTYTVIRMYWAKSLPPRRPLWLMRTTLILWAVTVVGGVANYLSLYML